MPNELESLIDHISNKSWHDQGYGNAKEDPDMRSLVNYDTNKWDWADLHLEYKDEYLGGITFYNGENDDIECTVPRTLKVIRNIFSGEVFNNSGRLYSFLAKKSGEDFPKFPKEEIKFSSSIESDYDYPGNDVVCSYIHQIGAIKVGDTFYIGMQRKNDSSVMFLGKLKVLDPKLIPLIKNSIVNNDRLRDRNFKFAEDEKPYRVKFY